MSVTRDLGINRMAGRGAFIDSVVSATALYYREVLQNLTPWQAPPKKLGVTEGPIEAEMVSVPEVIAEGFERAEDEAREL